jgi:hypothetical protein
VKTVRHRFYAYMSQTRRERAHTIRRRMTFEIIGPIRDVEVIASGAGVRIRKHLWRKYGKGDWRKMKGIAEVMYPNGRVCVTEIHWFEAHGVGKRMVKAKRDLRDL